MRRGFTVLEISIALVIGLFLLIGVWTLFRTGHRIFQKVDANLEAVQAGSIIMTVISDDLRAMTLTKKHIMEKQDHTLPIKLDKTNWQPEFTAGNVKLSDKQPFKFPITDPESVTKDKREIITVEYSLKDVSSGGKPLYLFVRKTSKGEDTTHKGIFVKDVQFDFVAAKDDPKDKATPAPTDDQLYYVRVMVVGASTSVDTMAQGAAGTAAEADHYRVPIVTLFTLDSVSELVSARGMGQYWRDIQQPGQPGQTPAP